jgi:hypothetical protein
MAFSVCLACLCWGSIVNAIDTCSAAVSESNQIVAENCLPGSPSTEWDVNGAGDPSIQGFATHNSINAGDTIGFKVLTDAASYRVDLYRLGYYGGLGARLVETVRPFAALPQGQPDCLYESDTHLVDCGNWDLSALWKVPGAAVSGLYFARLVREELNSSSANEGNWRGDASLLHWDARFSRPLGDQDPAAPPPLGRHTYGASRGKKRMANGLKEPRASHIFFIVRQDVRPADIVVQIMDTTWQAYNCWGSLNTYGYACADPRTHAGSPQYQSSGKAEEGGKAAAAPPRAYKASFNRPYATRAFRAVNMPLNAEYPLIRFLESQGYDVQYWSGLDTHRLGAEKLAGQDGQFRLFISNSHDEYWSRQQRQAVTAARDRVSSVPDSGGPSGKPSGTGVHLAFFSGNEVYWKIRFEPSKFGSVGVDALVDAPADLRTMVV